MKCPLLHRNIQKETNRETEKKYVMIAWGFVIPRVQNNSLNGSAFFRAYLDTFLKGRSHIIFSLTNWILALLNQGSRFDDYSILKTEKQFRKLLCSIANFISPKKLLFCYYTFFGKRWFCSQFTKLVVEFHAWGYKIQ